MQRSNPAASFNGSLARPPWSYKLWMLAGSRERFFDRLISEYGDFVHYRGPIEFYLVNHPVLVKQVLQQTNDIFDKKSPLYERVRRSFGGGMVVAEGDAWKRRRGVVQQLMGPKQVQAYFDLMVDSATAVSRTWEANHRRTLVFDVAAEMDNLTLEIVGRSLFQDGFDEARESIRQWTKVIDHFSSKPPLPIIRSAWFPSTLNHRLKATLRDFHGFIQRMIEDHRHREADSGLLSLLCRSDAEGEGQRLADEEIGDEVLGMIVGGHETTSVALTWVWYELSRRPVEEVLDSEPLPLGRRETVRKDFESSRPSASDELKLTSAWMAASTSLARRDVVAFGEDHDLGRLPRGVGSVRLHPSFPRATRWTRLRVSLVVHSTKRRLQVGYEGSTSLVPSNGRR